MAHFVAEQITEAETAVGEERGRKMVECAEAILKLWGHRAVWPVRVRPFRGFEPLLETLHGLDPQDGTPHYFRPPRPPQEEYDSPATKQWLDTADGIDHAARVLIRYCLAAAAESAGEKAREWLALSEAAAAHEEADLEIVRIVIRDADTFKAKSIEAIQREYFEKLVERLDAFVDHAKYVSGHLHAALDRAPTAKKVRSSPKPSRARRIKPSR